MIALIIGVVLLVLSGNVLQPVPLNLIENVVGWILVLYGIIVLLFGLVGRPMTPYSRRWWY